MSNPVGTKEEICGEMHLGIVLVLGGGGGRSLELRRPSETTLDNTAPCCGAGVTKHLESDLRTIEENCNVNKQSLRDFNCYLSFQQCWRSNPGSVHIRQAFYSIPEGIL